MSAPEVVETHDCTAADPTFLVYLKSLSNTVAVPAHWAQKRKYLQGKRGVEKAAFALPKFIEDTGIAEIRSATQDDEDKASAKQKGRARVAPKMGKIDVDYKTLHDAFFKYQTKVSELDDVTAAVISTTANTHTEISLASPRLASSTTRARSSRPTWVSSSRVSSPRR